MPVLSGVRDGLEERIIPPVSTPQEDSGDSERGEKDYMILIGVQEKSYWKQLIEEGRASEAILKAYEKEVQSGLLEYTPAILIARFEETPLPITSDALEFELAYYLFFDRKNCIHSRIFEWGFLSNIEGKWYTILLHDEKYLLDIISSSDLPKAERKKGIANIKKYFIKPLISEGIIPNGEYSVFSEIYLGKQPIIVECEKNPSIVQDFRGYREYREYLEKTFMNFKEKFKNYIIVNRGDLPEKIANYHIMGLDGKVLNL